MNTEKQYMNVATGYVGAYDEWFYENQDGLEVNAVDLGEVIEVNCVDGQWEEA